MVLPTPLPARRGGGGKAAHRYPLGSAASSLIYVDDCNIDGGLSRPHPMSHQVALRKPKYADLRTFR